MNCQLRSLISTNETLLFVPYFIMCDFFCFIDTVQFFCLMLSCKHVRLSCVINAYLLIFLMNLWSVVFVNDSKWRLSLLRNSWICRTGICRTRKWRTKSQGWNLQDWKLTDLKMTDWKWRTGKWRTGKWGTWKWRTGKWRSRTRGDVHTADDEVNAN